MKDVQNLASVIVLDADGTMLHVRKLCNLEQNKRNNKIRIHGKHLPFLGCDKCLSHFIVDRLCEDGSDISYYFFQEDEKKTFGYDGYKFLIFSKEKLDRVLHLASQKAIPIIVLTYGTHPYHILESILNPAAGQEKKYNLEFKEYTLNIEKIYSYRGHQLHFKSLDHDNQEGDIFFFNQDDTTSIFFQNYQGVLEKMRKEEKIKGISMNLSYPAKKKVWFPRSGLFFSYQDVLEERKPISALVCIDIVNAIHNNTSEKNISFKTKADRKKIIFVDDNPDNIEWAEAMGMTAIPAGESAFLRLSEEQKEENDFNDVLQGHYDKLLYQLDPKQFAQKEKAVNVIKLINS